jgi:hypothetical protein
MVTDVAWVAVVILEPPKQVVEVRLSPQVGFEPTTYWLQEFTRNFDSGQEKVFEPAPY